MECTVWRSCEITRRANNTSVYPQIVLFESSRLVPETLKSVHGKVLKLMQKDRVPLQAGGPVTPIGDGEYQN